MRMAISSSGRRLAGRRIAARTVALVAVVAGAVSCREPGRAQQATHSAPAPVDDAIRVHTTAGSTTVVPTIAVPTGPKPAGTPAPAQAVGASAKTRSRDVTRAGQLTLIATNARMLDVVLGLTEFGSIPAAIGVHASDEALVSIHFLGSWKTALGDLGVEVATEDRDHLLLITLGSGGATRTRTMRIPGDRRSHIDIQLVGSVGAPPFDFLCAIARLDCPRDLGDGASVALHASMRPRDAVTALVEVTGQKGSVAGRRLRVRPTGETHASSATVRPSTFAGDDCPSMPAWGPEDLHCDTSLWCVDVEQLVVPLVIRGHRRSGYEFGRALVAARGYESVAIEHDPDVVIVGDPYWQDCILATRRGLVIALDLSEVTDSGVRFTQSRGAEHLWGSVDSSGTPTTPVTVAVPLSLPEPEQIGRQHANVAEGSP